MRFLSDSMERSQRFAWSFFSILLVCRSYSDFQRNLDFRIWLQGTTMHYIQPLQLRALRKLLGPETNVLSRFRHFGRSEEKVIRHRAWFIPFIHGWNIFLKELFWTRKNHTRKRDRPIRKWPTEVEQVSLRKVRNLRMSSLATVETPNKGRLYFWEMGQIRDFSERPLFAILDSKVK